MSRTLFDITADLQALDDLLAEAGGDVTDPRVDQAVSHWMDELDVDLRTKVDNYAAFIREMEARSAERKAEAQRLQARASADASSATFLKMRLKMALELRGLAKLETARYRVAVSYNGGSLPVLVEAEANIPQEFIREQVIRDIDKDKLRQALESGQAIPGARLGARGTRLSIR